MSVQHASAMSIGKTRSPWAVWWLSYLTIGVYYLVWYVKLNRELARAAGPDVRVGSFGLWFSQCVPIAAWISLAHTASRLGTAQRRAGTAPTASGGMTILSSMWFGSQTRYLQRRANQLWRHLELQRHANGQQAAAHIEAVYTSPVRLAAPAHAAEAPAEKIGESRSR